MLPTFHLIVVAQINVLFTSVRKLFKNDVQIRSIDQLRAELEEIKNNFRYSSVNFYDNININRSIFHVIISQFVNPHGFFHSLGV